VRALYDFTPQEPGELEFRRGEVITGQYIILAGECFIFVLCCNSSPRVTIARINASLFKYYYYEILMSY